MGKSNSKHDECSCPGHHVIFDEICPDKFCSRCEAFCSTVKDLQQLTANARSGDIYKYYTIREAERNASRGCPLCREFTKWADEWFTTGKRSQWFLCTDNAQQPQRGRQSLDSKYPEEVLTLRYIMAVNKAGGEQKFLALHRCPPGGYYPSNLLNNY